MPKIYLSPSTQEYNPYVTGAGSEESFMNLLADAMEPILLLNGIQFSPQYAGHDRRLLHPAGQRRTVRLLSGPPLQCLRPRCRGPEPGHSRLLLSHQRQLLPGSGAVRGKTSGTSTPCRRRCPHGPPPLWEIRQPRFPSVLLELGYHDNPDDALWIQENIPRIAANLVLSLTEYFGLPYTAPTPQPGQVSTVSGGPVNLRSGPSLQSPVTARLPDGDGVTVYTAIRTGTWCPTGASGLRQRPLYPPVVRHRQNLPGDLRK